MKKSVIKFATFGFVLLLSLASSSFADKVSPPRIYLTVPRGKTETTVLFLRGTTLNEKVVVYPTDILIDRKGNYQFEKLEDWKYSALDWLKLYKVMKLEEKTEGKIGTQIIAPLYKEKEVLTLKTDRDTYIGIKIKAPFNVKPGQYYAGIMVEPAEFRVSRGVVEGKAVAVRKKTRIAVPIFITVPGRTPRLGGEVVSVDADIKKEEVKILATFENTGEMIEFVKGVAHIVNKKDKKVYDVVTMKALNPISPDGTGEIYPETLRDFEGVIKRPLPIGDYEVRVAFDYGVKFREARMTTSFSVSEAVAVEQKELLVLAVEPELMELTMPRGGRTLKGLRVSNLDFDPLEVVVVCSDWIKVEPEKFTLPAGRSENLRVVVTIPQGEEPQRTGKIVFKPERGKPFSIDVIVK